MIELNQRSNWTFRGHTQGTRAMNNGHEDYDPPWRRNPPQPSDLDEHRPLPDTAQFEHLIGDAAVTNVERYRLAEQWQHESKPPLEQLRTLILGLSYGEMIELAEGLYGCAVKLSEGKELSVSAEVLPKIVHAWAANKDALAGPAIT